jgi:hypothetical protein
MTFGPGRWSHDVRQFIRTWFWDPPDEPREVILVSDAQTGAPVGYSSWRHRYANMRSGVQERAIEIEWFGIDVSYQAHRTEDDESIAAVLLQTVEDRARSHPDSTVDMPLVLEVDKENLKGQDVWEHFHFRFFEWAEVGAQNDRYLRMIRSASGDDE